MPKHIGLDHDKLGAPASHKVVKVSVLQQVEHFDRVQERVALLRSVFCGTRAGETTRGDRQRPARAMGRVVGCSGGVGCGL